MERPPVTRVFKTQGVAAACLCAGGRAVCVATFAGDVHALWADGPAVRSGGCVALRDGGGGDGGDSVDSAGTVVAALLGSATAVGGWPVAFSDLLAFIN